MENNYQGKCEEPPQGIPDDHTIIRNDKKLSIESNNISTNKAYEVNNITK